MIAREAKWWFFCTPYGCWHCADGRIVLFNRAYKPIGEWSPKHGSRVPPSCRLYSLPYESWDRWENWEQPPVAVEVYGFVREEWFYTDSNPPWLEGRASAETRVKIMLILGDFLDGKMPMCVH